MAKFAEFFFYEVGGIRAKERAGAITPRPGSK